VFLAKHFLQFRPVVVNVPHATHDPTRGQVLRIEPAGGEMLVENDRDQDTAALTITSADALTSP
jgi:hypothetical protein